MKRILTLALLFSLLLTPLAVGVGYSLFAYSGQQDHAEVAAKVSSANTLLNENEKTEYYRVYFFASPYYATGAEINGTTVTDPLEIANSEANPYNSDEEYFLIGSDGIPEHFSNVELSAGNYCYATYKNRNTEIAIGSAGAFDLFSKKDYTGYIRANPDLGISENTSTYVSLTVQGNIGMEQLNGIIASSEFRDQYGFGPEFIGWTYDQSAASERILFSNGERYTTANSHYLGDSAGNRISGTAYLLGNYGFQGEIEQVSSTTSLKAIDDTTEDGSLAGDHVIYLYPVFLAKNYSKPTSVGGKYTPILKFRVNADASEQEGLGHRYEYQQTAEIDYSVDRYTVGLFQRTLNTDKTNVNYYIHNFYLDSGASVQLDICSVDSRGWGNAWSSILTDDTIKGFQLPQGYYNIDITFVYGFGTSTPADTDLSKLKQIYEDSDRYTFLYTSQDANGGSKGTVQYPVDQTSGSMTAYYVIGFQRVEEFRLVGDDLNHSLSNYTADGYKTLYSVTQLGDRVQYLVDRVYLSAGNRISVLIASEDGKSGADLSYTFASFEQTVLTDINGTYRTNYCALGQSATDGASIFLKNGQLTVGRSGSYTFIFNVSYQNGKPSSISVAYQENDSQYSLIVLNGKPSNRYFTHAPDFDRNIVARCNAPMRSFLNIDSGLSTGPALPETTADVSDIETLFSYYSGKKMIDTATGEVLSYELFQNGTFCLNRDYVVYFE